MGYGKGSATGGMNHALLWNGDNVAQDLHRFLPAGAVHSFATGIDDDGTVVGYATFADDSSRPFLWVPVPEPAGCALVLLPALLLSRRPRARRSSTFPAACRHVLRHPPDELEAMLWEDIAAHTR